jgi:hypothetical protein
MSLTSRINLAIEINCMGHGEYYGRLFSNMRFHPTELTFSGLRWMWRKKEYGRIYTGLWRVKKRHQLAARTKMINGMSKMEVDGKGRSYASGRNVGEGNVKGEEPKRKKARSGNNSLASSCKCGGLDHQRVLSKSCPWKDLSKKEIFKNMRGE